jgi:hypothetical protein
LGDSPDFPVAGTFLQEVGKVVGKLHVTGAQEIPRGIGQVTVMNPMGIVCGQLHALGTVES